MNYLTVNANTKKWIRNSVFSLFSMLGRWCSYEKKRYSIPEKWNLLISNYFRN